MTLDYITGVVVLAIAVMVAFGSAAVTYSYAKALNKTKQKYGLLLWHIVAVSSAVSGTWISLALGLLGALGWLETPRVLRFFLYAFFGILTIASLVLIGLQVRQRLDGEKRDSKV